MLKELFEVMSDSLTVNLKIVKKGEEVTVMVAPKANVQDESVKGIPPFVCSGTPEVVEKELIEAFKEPFARLSSTVSGIAEFEAKEAEIKKKNVAVKAEKEQKKSAIESEDKEIEKKLEQGRKAISEEKEILSESIQRGIEAILKGRKHSEFSKFVDEVKALKAKKGTGTLFGEPIQEVTQEEELPQKSPDINLNEEEE